MPSTSKMPTDDEVQVELEKHFTDETSPTKLPTDEEIRDELDKEFTGTMVEINKQHLTLLAEQSQLVTDDNSQKNIQIGGDNTDNGGHNESTSVGDNSMHSKHEPEGNNSVHSEHVSEGNNSVHSEHESEGGDAHIEHEPEGDNLVGIEPVVPMDTTEGGTPVESDSEVEFDDSPIQDQAELEDNSLGYPPRGQLDSGSSGEEEYMMGGVWRDSTTRDGNHLFKPPKFRAKPGSKLDISSAAIEIDYFSEFFDPSLIELAVFQTNMYAQFHMDMIARKHDALWVNTNKEEMSAFIGLLIMMGIDHKSCLEDYWSTDPYLINPGISKVMTRCRFQQLHRYFHLADAVTDPKRVADEEERKKRMIAEPLYKVDPWLKPVLECCQTKFQMGQDISIDEGMVAFKGRSLLKQRLPHKPDKDGFKVWQVCDSDTSYISNFEPYLGVKYLGQQEGRKKEKGAIQEMVMRMLKPFKGKNHILFCDSLFTKVETAVNLAKENTYMVGSYNKRNRKAMPPQLIPPSGKKKLVMETGYMKAATRVMDGGLGLNITAYQDESAQIYILNTVYPPLETVASKNERNIPLSLSHYRIGMGGVDRANQKRKYYHVGRKNRRWWVYLANYCIDVSLVNAYECFKFDHPDTKLSHKMFNLRTAKQLIGGFSNRKVPVVRQVSATIAANLSIDPANISQHVVVKMDGRQKVCKHCSKLKIKTNKGSTRETYFGCEICGVNLHKNTCFDAFHRNLLYCNKVDKGTQTGELSDTEPPTSPSREPSRSNSPVDQSATRQAANTEIAEPQPSTSRESRHASRATCRHSLRIDLSPHPVAPRCRGKVKGKGKGKK